MTPTPQQIKELDQWLFHIIELADCSKCQHDAALVHLAMILRYATKARELVKG